MPQKNSFHYLFITLLAVAFAIRLMGLSKGIWLDEYTTIFAISQGGLIDTLRMVRRIEVTHPPLYQLLLTVWSYMGKDEPFLRLLSVTISVATLALMMRWMRQYANLAALLAGLFFATMPILLRYSQEIRGYGLLIFATVLTFFFATMISKQPQKIGGYLGLAFGLGLAVSTHLVGIMIIMPVCVFIVLASKLNRRQIYWGRVLLMVAPSLLTFAFIYFFYLIYLDGFTKEWWMPPISGQSLVSTTSSLLGFPALFWSLGLVPENAYYAHTVLLIILLIIILILSWLGDWRRGLPLLTAAILYWLSLVLYSLVRKPVLIDRTLLPALALVVGFAAIQIATIRRSVIQYTLIIGVGLASFIFAGHWVSQAACKPVEAWQETAQSVQEQWQPGDVVLLYPSFIEGPFRYYFDDLPEESVIKINSHPSLNEVESEVNGRLESLTTAGHLPTIFVVTRTDSIIQKEPETYRRLLEMLQTKSQKPLVVYDFLEPTLANMLQEKSP
jgi:uncharacterized membrane protein